jgi:hypothetical protein
MTTDTRRRIPVTAENAPPRLRLSTNRKTCTSASYRPASEKWEPVPNAFGVSRDACEPHRTPFCEACYAARIEKVYRGVRDLMGENYAAVMTYRNRPEELAEMFAALLDTSAAAQRLAGVTAPTFRWQWNGELCHETHAQAISRAHAMRPGVTGWVYTRAHSWAHAFRLRDTGEPPENLAVFLSVDRDNLRSARRAVARWPWLRLAFSGDSWEETTALAGAMEQARGLKCPELAGRVPLVDPVTTMGACTACAHCHPTGTGNVRFSTGKDAPR